MARIGGEFADLFFGRMRLGRAFWLYGFVPRVLVHLTIYQLQISNARMQPPWSLVSAVAFDVAVIAYFAFWGIGAWRCASAALRNIPPEKGSTWGTRIGALLVKVIVIFVYVGLWQNLANVLDTLRS